MRNHETSNQFPWCPHGQVAFVLGQMADETSTKVAGLNKKTGWSYVFMQNFAYFAWNQ